jgi:hypothetical protein
MRLIIRNKNSVLMEIDTSAVALASPQLEGRKMWKGSRQLTFETSEHNLSIIRKFPLDGERDERENTSAFDGQELEVGWQLGGDAFHPILEPSDWQQKAYAKLRRKHVFALFSEPGTGKTKAFTDIICNRAHGNLLSGVLVLAWPKGVHHQWVEEQLPAHMWKNVPYEAASWDGKSFPDWIEHNDPSKLQIITGNIEMLNSKKGVVELKRFVKAHAGKLLVNVDESQTIKNKSTKRHQILSEIAAGTEQRSIMTGTPIAKDLTDEWSQFYFLDPSIIGHRYKTTFQRQFCIMGGFEGREVKGHRNIEKFKALTEPYIYRITKDEALDLPPKVYDKIVFDMTKEQKKHQKTLVESFIMALETGEVSTVETGAVMMMRLQQLSCGYIVDDEGKMHELKENPRLDVLKNLIEQRHGKIIIWCRFQKDIELIEKMLGERCRSYYGKTSDRDREEAKRLWLEEGSGIDYLVASPGAIGAGQNLQGLCHTAIYYSNTFNAIERWQSEDRIHRIGTKETCTYFDLVARGSVDAKILRNLKAKKSLSSMVLDDIKEIIDELSI